MTCGLCKQPIRGDERYTTDHYQCGADLTQSWRTDLDAMTARAKAAERRAQTVRELVQKWREDAAAEQRVSFCADELEAALAEPEPTP